MADILSLIFGIFAFLYVKKLLNNIFFIYVKNILKMQKVHTTSLKEC